jgi:hypothetical protein
MERRIFLKSAAGIAAASYERVLGANERINIGLIGSGGQGSSDFKAFLANPDVNPVAVADVYRPNLEKGVALAGGKAAAYKDFRQLLDRKEIDAVIVATPDHWHALPTVMACRAGKDVYCEKPLSLTIREGRAMLDAARKHNRIVQTGSQQRSGKHYAQAVEIIRSGKLGKVCHVAGSLIRNVKTKKQQIEDAEAPGDREMHREHVRNFLDCVKSRKRPNAEIKEGYLTATMCHLGNIATRLGRSVQWDAGKEEIIGDPDANRWLSRPYRAPWKLA